MTIRHAKSVASLEMSVGDCGVAAWTTTASCFCTNPTVRSMIDFRLTEDEMASMRALDTGKGTHDPEDPVNEERLLGFRIHD